MLYLSQADTEKLDIRMTDVVPAIEDAFRRVGNGRAVVAPRVRVLHPPLQKNSMGAGRPWVRDLRIIPGAIEDIGYGVRLGASLRRQGGGVMLVLFDWDTMALKALISDHLVHAVRSTAPCGVITKYLANSPEEIDQATYLKGKIITTYNDGILTHVPPYRDLVALVQSGKMSEADFSTKLADIVTGNAKGRSHAEEI